MNRGVAAVLRSLADVYRVRRRESRSQAGFSISTARTRAGAKYRLPMAQIECAPMAQMTPSAAAERILSSINQLRSEFRSVSFRFLVLQVEEHYWLLEGRVVLEDLDDPEAVAPSFRGDVLPLRFLSWSLALGEGILAIKRAFDTCAFDVPGDTRKVVLIQHVTPSGTILEAPSRPSFDFNDQINYVHEGERGTSYWAHRVYWAGAAVGALVPAEAVNKIKAKIATLGIHGIEGLMQDRFGRSHYSLSNASTVEVFVPFRVAIDESCYGNDALRVTVRTGLFPESASISLTYQVLERDYDGPVLAKGHLSIPRRPTRSEGRFHFFESSATVPMGRNARVLLSYRDSVTQDQLAHNSAAVSMDSPRGQSVLPGHAESARAIEPKASRGGGKKVFVVHGRNEAARQRMFDFLRALHLEPIEWSQALSLTGEGTPHNDHTVQAALTGAAAIVVLLSGDDLAQMHPQFLKPQDKDFERNLTPQARPNVLFKAGMAFGREPRKVIFAELGDVRPFSDIDGRNFVRLDDSPAHCKDLAERLKTVGCQVDMTGTDWLKYKFLECLPHPVSASALPHVHGNHERGQRFVQSWEEFKRLLADYKREGPSAEREEQYRRLRRELMTWFGVYRKSLFQKLAVGSDEFSAQSVLKNILRCVDPLEIAHWEEQVQRSMTGIHCFDRDIYAAVADDLE